MDYKEFVEITHRDDMSQYRINRLGQLLSLKSGRIMSGSIDRNGYKAYCVELDDGAKTTVKIHQLVAAEFIPNPENKPQVNHIDEDKTNSCVDNLEWVSHKENLNHATCQERRSKNRMVPVNEYTEDGRYIRTWSKASSVSEYLYDKFRIDLVTEGAIWKCCNGKQCIGLGRRWRYYEGDTSDLVLTAADIPTKYIRRDTWDYMDMIEDVPEEYLYQPMDIGAVEAYFMASAKLSAVEKRMLHDSFAELRQATDDMEKRYKSTLEILKNSKKQKRL